jgi:uncharacterized protein YmfQ (DUF2313 family)
MNHADLILALLPLPYTRLGRVASEAVAESAALDGVLERAAALQAEISPATASEMLADWEVSLGLPDACAPAAQTVAQRRVAADARWREVGGQSRRYFIGLAASRGYAITLAEPAPHNWRVTVPETALVTRFRVGSKAGTPLRTWQRHPLTCTFMRAKPAHTRLWIAFPGFIDEPWLVAVVRSDGETSVEAAVGLLHMTLHTTMPQTWN